FEPSPPASAAAGRHLLAWRDRDGAARRGIVAPTCSGSTSGKRHFWTNCPQGRETPLIGGAKRGAAASDLHPTPDLQRLYFWTNCPEASRKVPPLLPLCCRG